MGIEGAAEDVVYGFTDLFGESMVSMLFGFTELASHELTIIVCGTLVLA